MTSKKIRDLANKGIQNRFFSPTGMSARSRVLEIEFGGFSGTDAAFESAVKSAASACNYLQGSSIVVRQDDRFFIKDGDQRRHALPSKVATRYRGVCHFARCTSGRLCLEPLEVAAWQRLICRFGAHDQMEWVAPTVAGADASAATGP